MSHFENENHLEFARAGDESRAGGETRVEVATPARRSPRRHGDFSEMLPGRLYAGMAPAQQKWFVTWTDLAAAGIDTVVSLTAPFDPPPAAMQHHELHIHDVPDLVLAGVSKRWLSRAVRLIDRALADGRVVYVHCAQGISRTGLVIVAWAMRHFDLTAREAITWARERRGCIAPNRGFVALLQQWHPRDPRREGAR